jgi:multicomponent Na+:H+ antiporter subunit C
MDILGHYNHFVFVLLMMLGFHVLIASRNLVKKIVGLNVFQTSVFILYISLGKVEGGAPPITEPGVTVYSNPLPSVLILTAIVVGVATTSLALSLAIRIRAAYGSVEEDQIEQRDREAAA